MLVACLLWGGPCQRSQVLRCDQRGPHPACKLQVGTMWITSDSLGIISYDSGRCSYPSLLDTSGWIGGTMQIFISFYIIFNSKNTSCGPCEGGFYSRPGIPGHPWWVCQAWQGGACHGGSSWYCRWNGETLEPMGWKRPPFPSKRGAFPQFLETLETSKSDSPETMTPQSVISKF